MLWLQLFGPLRPFAFAPPSSPAGPWFLAALVLGVAGLFAPGNYFQPRAFETRGRFYRRLGVEAFRAWSTNGDRINRYVRARHPGYSVHGGDFDKALANCLVGERTHLAFGLFGLVTSVYTFAVGWYFWAAWMTITNIIGNLYPVLLQRHTRARILRARDKASDGPVQPREARRPPSASPPTHSDALTCGR